MAIAYVSAGSVSSAAAQTSRSPALPVTRTNGNTLISICITKNNASHTWSGTGWSKIGSNVNSGASFTASIGWRIVDGSEAAPTISWTGSSDVVAIVWQLSGANATQPFTNINTNSGSTSTHSVTGITGTYADSQAIYIDAANANTGLATPSGWTEHSDTGSTTYTSRVTLGSKSIGTGSSGNISVTGANATWSMWVLELYTPLISDIGNISSANAFGTASAESQVSPSAISSAETFGTLTVGSDSSISPSGIASAEAFGTLSSSLSVSPTGIDTGSALGTPAIDANISPSAITSAEAFGTLSNSLSISPSGIDTGSALGTLVINASVSPSAIAGAEAFGTLSNSLSVSPSGIATASALGTPAIDANISPSSIAGAEAFGTLSNSLSVSPSGIASAESFGTPSVGSDTTILLQSISSAEAFGTSAVSLSVAASSVSSSETFGTSSASPILSTSSFASVEAFGSPSIYVTLSASAIASTETFGTTSLAGDLSLSGISSSAEVGSLSADLVFSPSGISSAQAFGVSAIGLDLYVESIASAEEFGTLFIADRGISYEKYLSQIELPRQLAGFTSDQLAETAAEDQLTSQNPAQISGINIRQLS